MHVKRKIAHVEEVAKMNGILFLSYITLHLPGKNDRQAASPDLFWTLKSVTTFLVTQSIATQHYTKLQIPDITGGLQGFK